MRKTCPICDELISDGMKAVACMLVTYHEIPSDVSFAVDHPEKCLALLHVDCFDAEDYDDE